MPETSCNKSKPSDKHGKRNTYPEISTVGVSKKRVELEQSELSERSKKKDIPNRGK